MHYSNVQPRGNARLCAYVRMDVHCGKRLYIAPCWNVLTVMHRETKHGHHGSCVCTYKTMWKSAAVEDRGVGLKALR